MSHRQRRGAGSAEMPVERRLGHVANAFTGAVAVMADPIPARTMAERSLRRVTHCSEKAVRNFLTSPYGGAFGIDVTQRLASGDDLERAITVTIREWMKRKPTAAETVALGITPTMPFLTAVITAAGTAQD